MIFEFTLSNNKGLKKIHLVIKDESHRILLNDSTSLTVLKKDWNELKQRPFNIYKKKEKVLNEKLNYIKVQLAESISRETAFDYQSLKQLFIETRRMCNEEENLHTEGTLLYYMQMYIASKKNFISPSTYKRYNVFFKLIKKFEGYLNKKIYVDAINDDFVKDFFHFGNLEEYSENTIYRTINFVKAVFNFLKKRKIKLETYDFEIKKQSINNQLITLSESDIQKIQKICVTQKMQIARDWLLISCFTGQRFSDFMKFSRDQIIEIEEKKCIEFIQKKTSKKILLPLHPIVLKILYNNNNNNNFPPPLSLQHYNDLIKDIAKLAQINELVKTRIRVGFRVKNMLVEKWEAITSHIGRRSFATNFYGKIPTPLLMDATGHTTEQMFIKYINSVDKSRVLLLSHYFDFIHNDKSIKKNENTFLILER